MDGYLGMIKLSIGADAPLNWKLCDGSLLQVAEFPDLFDLIGHTFGDAPEGGFRIPALQIQGGFALIKVALTPGESGQTYIGMVSQINYWTGNVTPESWLECDGRLLAKQDYPSLSKLIGNQYGGDSERFALPNMPTNHGIRHLICFEGEDPSAQGSAGDDD